jgi:N-formylglutamate amidohydrolase
MTADLEPRLLPGPSALLISVPHAGVGLPDDIAQRFTAAAHLLPDTDWYVDRLYDWARAAGAGMLIASASRYVADLNRPPDDTPLYDPATTRLITGVVPLQAFDGQPLYRAGLEPPPDEAGDRIRTYWRPYHALLQAELERSRSRHGHAVLLDAHSIRHELPLLFEGRLPDLNLGSNDGRSAAPSLLRSAREALAGSSFSLVVDGRFRGGYITRHYARPEAGLHALQLELAQCAYMQEAPPQWEAVRARGLQAVLQRLVTALQEWKVRGH